VVELFTSIVPDLFLKKDSLNVARLLDYYLFILNRVYFGGLDDLIKNFADYEDSIMHGLHYILSPVLGITVNLFTAFINHAKDPEFEPLDKNLLKSDGFDLNLFTKLHHSFKADYKLDSKKDTDMFNIYDKFLTILTKEAEKANMTQKKFHFISSIDQMTEEDLKEDENVCIICYHFKNDTVFEPCGHTTCQKCISLHLLNNDRCPFCNVAITETKKIV